VLPEENEDQVAAFVADNPAFQPAPLAFNAPGHARGQAIQMTPLVTGCDGFFVSVLAR
jgi:16S rRNA C967 or C1407 C5-methylase (RsmB/RsmF family)